MSKTIAEMTAEVREVNERAGWREKTNSFGDYLALIHSELSEALEAFRDWGLKDATAEPRGIGLHGLGRPDPSAPPPKPEGVGSEFADVLIRLIDTCDVLGIDLDAEYERKIAFNRTRPYKHGGRAL